MIKKMFLLLAVMAGCVIGAQAQEVRAEVMAGLNLSSVSRFDTKAGFHMGILAVYDFKSGAPGTGYINGGLVLSLKGAEDKSTSLKATVNEYYFDIPVHIGYRHSLSPVVALFGEAGPYFGFGAFGKTSLKLMGEKASEDTFGDNGLRRFDFGLGFRLGAEFCKRVPVSIGWDFGLVDIVPDNPGDAVKNTNFLLSIGYKF